VAAWIGIQPILMSVPDPDNPDAWSVTVLDNKFPALSLSATGGFIEQGRHFQEFDGYGAHEVIIESPHHSIPLARQPLAQVERLLSAMQMRYKTLMQDGRLRSIILFKNHGVQAGTSLRHPHWQIIATPVVPRLLRQKHAIAMDYYDRSFKCLHQVLMSEELAGGERILAQNDAFVAVLPFASHQAYQIRIFPRHFQSCFAQCTELQLTRLAAILKEVLGRLYSALGDPAFNLTLVSAPIGDENEDYFLWHIDIMPRLFTTAGFEMGSGMSINTVLPEAAARELSAAALPETETAMAGGIKSP
jgi:UDPglucose--hexose-1-phosphate uridylyltransferase